jgi:hypothetical protein
LLFLSVLLYPVSLHHFLLLFSNSSFHREVQGSEYILNFTFISHGSLRGFFFHFFNVPYILESNPHPFYSFRGLKNQMRFTVACGLDLRSRAGFWKNDGAALHAGRTIQHSNLLFYLLHIIIYYSSDSPSSLKTKSLFVLRWDCARLLRKTCFMVPVWLIGPRCSVGF